MPCAPLGIIEYMVMPGDTLWIIANKFNTTVANILLFNPLPNPALIYPGQRLIIPVSPPEAIIYTVKAGDTLGNIAYMYGTSVNNLILFNYLIPPYIIYPGQQLVVTASLK